MKKSATSTLPKADLRDTIRSRTIIVQSSPVMTCNVASKADEVVAAVEEQQEAVPVRSLR